MRQAIAKEYAKTVKRLVNGGNGKAMSAPEDQLADEYMPEVFFDFWLRD
jgi:hypothetical protein